MSISEPYTSLATKLGLPSTELTSYDLGTISIVVGLEVVARGWSRQTVAELTGYDVATIGNALDNNTVDISAPVQAAVLGAVAEQLGGVDLVVSGRSIPDLSRALAEALADGDAPPHLVAHIPRGRVAHDFHMLALAFTGPTPPLELTPRYNFTLALSLVADALENGADFSARFTLDGLVEDAEAGLFSALGPFELGGALAQPPPQPRRVTPTLATAFLLGDDAATATSRDWVPGDETATLTVDVCLLGLPVPLHGEIGLDVARCGEPPDGDPRHRELAELIVGRLCRDRDIAMRMILRTGVGPLIYERLDVRAQEVIMARLGAPDYEELLEPLTRRFSAEQLGLWLDLQRRDRWWDDVGERIFLSVKAEPQGPVLGLLEELDRRSPGPEGPPS